MQLPQKTLAFLLAVLTLGGTSGTVQAMTSSNYAMPQYQSGFFSGSSTSQNYRLNAVSAGVLGNPTSSSYRLNVGFPSVTGGTVTLSLDSGAVNLGKLSPGVPISGQTTATVTTDSATGYSIALQKNQLLSLSDGSQSIVDLSAFVSAPAPWVGPGFGLTMLSGSAIEAKWGSGTNYAAIPTGAYATVHSVPNGISAPDVTVVKYKLDVSSLQVSGQYSTHVSYLVTVLP